MTQQEMLKIAYDRGVAMALEDEEAMTKEAFAGGLLGRAAGWLGKKTLAPIGKALVGGVGKVSPGTGKVLSNMGVGSSSMSKKMIEQGVTGGLISSGLGAAMAPEGQGWEAAKSSFLPGAVGFGAWPLGSRATRLAISRGVGAVGGRGAMASVRRSAGKPWFSKTKRTLRGKGVKDVRKTRDVKQVEQTPMMRDLFKHPGSVGKAMGSKALMRLVPFGGALALSGAVTPSEHTPAVPSSAAVYNLGRQSMGRGFGVTPQQSYPRNY